MTCQTIQDFLTNLSGEMSKCTPGCIHHLSGDTHAPDCIHRRVVHVNRIEQNENRDGTVVTIIIQVSAVVNLGDDGQYLLEAGENCGTDYRDASARSSGTDRADELMKRLRDYCKNNGLEVRPGLVGF